MSKKKRSKYSSNLTKKAPEKKHVEIPLWAKVAAGVIAAVLVLVVVLLCLPVKQYAYIEVADYGTIKVELYEDVAPKTVKNFVSLAKNGFYDGLTFHRIRSGFMIQGGDPQGDGYGGNYVNGVRQTIVGEFSSNGYENNLSHKRGVISMARSSEYDSASSQFFIVHEDSTFLDGDYAAFGEVVSGIEIVDAICLVVQPTDDNGTVPAEEQPVITSIYIETTLFGFVLSSSKK